MSKSKKKPHPSMMDQWTSKWNSTSEIMANDQFRFILGIIVFAFNFYLFLSFISFFFTGASDQSHLDNMSVGDLVGINNEISNWSGHFGAYFAEVIINDWIGVSALLFCFLLLTCSLNLMGIRKVNLFAQTTYTFVMVIWSSLFLAFFFVSGYQDSYLYLGGYTGYYITQVLQANLGWLGTCLVLLSTFLITLSIAYKPTIFFIRNLFTLYIPQGAHWVMERIKKIEWKSPVKEVEEDNAEEQTTRPITPVATTPVTTTTPVAETIEELINVEETEPYTAPSVTPSRSQPDIEEEAQDEEEDIVSFKVNDNHNTESELVKQNKITGNYDPTADLSNYKVPKLDLLNEYGGINLDVDMDEQEANKQRITDTLRHYKIEIETITATVGPTITLYEIVPKQGVRIAKIRNLEDDIALSLAALGIRIIAPIPGKGTVGIEVPNKDPKMVSMHSIIASKKFQNTDYELPLALGKTITNDVFIIDLAKMPHILVAGATGQGKSVGLNAIITSLLYKKHPSQLKLVLIDPKKVEFNIYSNIEKHFLAKLPDAEEAIITDVTKVVATLNSICIEMDERYDLLKAANTRNIKEYNAKFTARQLNPEKGHRFMPYMVVIVDEFGDLIMTAGKEIELPIARIAQLARAVGIHMIIATQRPSTNIITGIIKANFPARIAFRVSSMIDSRTILDTPGANQLIGRGDMLYSQGGDLVRVQCAFVDTPEVEKVSDFIGEQRGYSTAFLLPEFVQENNSETKDIDLKERDPLFEEAALMVVGNQQGSTSMIQRKFSIGYNRAGRIMDQLEAAGIVGPYEGSKARQVLVLDDLHLEQLINNLN